MPDLLSHWPFALIAVFFAGLARGFSAFGAALIFVPLAGALVSTRVSAPVSLIVDKIMSLGQLPNALRRAQMPAVFVMARGAIIGAPLGAYALARLPSLTLRSGVGAMALLISGWRYASALRRWVTVAAGIVAGFCSGVAQIGRPPAVAYWLGGASDSPSARANIVAYFALSSVVSTVTYFFSPGRSRARSSLSRRFARTPMAWELGRAPLPIPPPMSGNIGGSATCRSRLRRS